MKNAGSIRQLDPNVVSRIAAGEAISSPSNAIKELIENSIDANSSRITIDIERGGYDLIRIIDDGCGINYHDLPIACKAHTTSKISEYSDLQKIGTFGFRGEALHSISMVTHLKIITMTENDEVGSVANYFEGELSGQIGFIAATKGTTIEARNLFYNYTMRLQGINPTAEAKKITDIISKYSVVYPQISFVVHSNNKETLMTYGKMSTSESVLKLLFGFDDINFFRCSFELNDGYFIELFLSEPNTKVKKKTNALFINGRLVKNDLLIKGIEEAYTKNNVFGAGVGSLQFCFITMTVPPNSIDVNIHPKKEKVKFLNEKETINGICERVREIVTEHSKKTSSSTKMNSIYNAFTKKPKASNSSNNQTILQAFSLNANKNQTSLDDFHNQKQNSLNENGFNDSVGTKSLSGFNDSVGMKSLNGFNDSVDTKSLNGFNDSVDTKSLSGFNNENGFGNVSDSGNKNILSDYRNFDNDLNSDVSLAPSNAVVSQANTECDSFSTKNTDFGANADLNDENVNFSLNLKPAVKSQTIFSHHSSRVPTLTSTADFSVNQKKVESMRSFENKSFIEAEDDGEVEAEASMISSLPTVSSMTSSPVRSSLFAAFNSKPKPSLSQLPKQNEASSKKSQANALSQKPTAKPKTFQFLTDDEFDEFNDDNFITEPSKKEAKPVSKKVEKKASNPMQLSRDMAKPSTEKAMNKNAEPLFPNTSDFITTTENKSPTKQIITNTNNNNSADSVNSSVNSVVNNDVGSVLNQPKNKEVISLNDLMGSNENENLIPDLPSFAPDLQKKAIESIEKKKNSPAKASSPARPKAKPTKAARSSVFDDLKYDPTGGSQALNSMQSQSTLTQSRHRNRSSANQEDSSMKKLEDLFSNVGDNMKRKFRVVKLLSIINLRKKREEEADIELKTLFHSNKMNLVNFIGTKSVIFTAPTTDSLVNRNISSESIDDESGITEINQDNNNSNSKVIYIFNLFALMKDLFIHKFLELFSNLPTFNVEMSLDEITKPVCKSSSISGKLLLDKKESVCVNDSCFFDDPEMKVCAKQCLDEKKDMLLEYFSVFYKNGMIKAMPDVIRGYRPSFASFPLFLEKLVTEVDWEDETNCFAGLIEQLAQLYSILPEDENAENPKVANNLLLQFKAAVLPELADEGYWPSRTLRENGSFVALTMPC